MLKSWRKNKQNYSFGFSTKYLILREEYYFEKCEMSSALRIMPSKSSIFRKGKASFVTKKHQSLWINKTLIISFLMKKKEKQQNPSDWYFIKLEINRLNHHINQRKQTVKINNLLSRNWKKFARKLKKDKLHNVSSSQNSSVF